MVKVIEALVLLAIITIVVAAMFTKMPTKPAEVQSERSPEGPPPEFIVMREDFAQGTPVVITTKRYIESLKNEIERLKNQLASEQLLNAVNSLATQ